MPMSPSASPSLGFELTPAALDACARSMPSSSTSLIESGAIKGAADTNIVRPSVDCAPVEAALYAQSQDTAEEFPARAWAYALRARFIAPL
eukprot:CAMPEP_0115164072 /NCGR_PEP_ID=MMETSP0227-20121206/72839_1 /TAXON_ID=89957 /ORGANISM="Polarella glacialis, Strain CCMP 1383" /LENGTH=90 /DNA_ID=CAMNT_0002576403 /DNA_START=92 /DNA_END=365 /DNA_ORIENTATION=-